MANTEGFCDRELGRDATQALRKAIKRAAKAQRRLNKTINRAQAYGQNNTSSSSESDAEHEVNRERGRGALEGFFRMRSHPHHHQHCLNRTSGRGLCDAGRHTLGFPGMMPHMGVGMHPHPGMHQHQHHPHHRHLHRHHHRGHFDPPHSFLGYVGPSGSDGRAGHGYGSSGAAHFGRHFSHFGGHSERAHSSPHY